jgi:hypothetical protein
MLELCFGMPSTECDALWFVFFMNNLIICEILFDKKNNTCQKGVSLKKRFNIVLED